MKKLLIFITAIFLTLIISEAAESEKNANSQLVQTNAKIQRENMFEKRLGLTEEQKIKAREIRIKGHEKMKPVIEEIIAKKQEAKMVKMSRIAIQVQEERLAVIDTELKILEKKAHDLRKANMKEFESILTKEQRKILKQMKKEGRQRYHSEHPAKMQMIQPQLLKKQQ